MTAVTNGHAPAQDFADAPPHNIAAEQAAIGGMLLSRDAISDVAAAIAPGDHYRPAHQLMHETILRLHDRGEPADPVTVAAELARRGELARVGGAPYLHTLLAAVPAAASAGHYARIVRDQAVLRRMIEAGTKIVQLASVADGTDAAGLAERAVAEAETVCPARSDRGLRWAGTVFEEVAESLDRGEERGLPLPWHDMNELLTGLAPGELVIIAGRPGSGKSLAAAGIAYHSAVTGVPVLMCSLEMSDREVMLRMISDKARVPLMALLRRRIDDGDWERIRRAYSDHFRELPLVIDDTSGATLTHIRSRLREMRRTNPAGLLIVDYLQLMEGGGESRQQAVAALSTGLKRIAREFSIPVVAVAALNRGSEHRPGKRPVISDLRDSGQQESDADVVILLFREEMYDPGTTNPGVVEFIVDKNRQGPRATVTLAFQGEYGRITDLARV